MHLYRTVGSKPAVVKNKRGVNWIPHFLNPSPKVLFELHFSSRTKRESIGFPLHKALSKTTI